MRTSREKEMRRIFGPGWKCSVAHDVHSSGAAFCFDLSTITWERSSRVVDVGMISSWSPSPCHGSDTMRQWETWAAATTSWILSLIALRTHDCTRSFVMARVNASRPRYLLRVAASILSSPTIPPSTQSLERGLVLDHQSPKLRLDSKALERPWADWCLSMFWGCVWARRPLRSLFENRFLGPGRSHNMLGQLFISYSTSTHEASLVLPDNHRRDKLYKRFRTLLILLYYEPSYFADWTIPSCEPSFDTDTHKAKIHKKKSLDLQNLEDWAPKRCLVYKDGPSFDSVTQIICNLPCKD